MYVRPYVRTAPLPVEVSTLRPDIRDEDLLLRLNTYATERGLSATEALVIAARKGLDAIDPLEDADRAGLIALPTRYHPTWSLFMAFFRQALHADDLDAIQAAAEEAHSAFILARKLHNPEEATA